MGGCKPRAVEVRDRDARWSGKLGPAGTLAATPDRLRTDTAGVFTEHTGSAVPRGTHSSEESPGERKEEFCRAVLSQRE